MDKNPKNFIRFAFIPVIGFLLIAALFGYAYFYSTIETYKNILLFLILLIIIITAFFIFMAIEIFSIYRSKKANNASLWLIKRSMNIMLPLITLAAGFFKDGKDIARNLYINLNNILVQSGKLKLDPKGVLVLLPHCLQDADCTYKITNNIENCHRCGKCCIGELAAVSEEMGVNIAVATGGTAARNIVNTNRPQLIMAVACERDLTSGITEVGGIPVLGILNERPNGPCNNTIVDIELLKNKLDEILVGRDRRDD